MRCSARNGHQHPITNSLVVLTVAHLDHTPENCTEDNLLAMCQRCHLTYDAAHHAQTRRNTKRAELEAIGQLTLWEEMWPPATMSSPTSTERT